jgi:hypothetical protein
MPEEKKDKDSSNRGLASADKETRERVAREGGQASHGGHGTSHGGGGSSENKGFASMSEEERKRIASKGGKH